MFKDFIEYDFNSEVNDYITSYDPTKLNMGYLMTRNQDSDGQTYVTPVEPKFLRGFEIGGSAAFQINSLGFLKYNDDVSWIFYTNFNPLGGIAKRIFLATYNKTNNQISEVGSINVNYTPNTSHECNSIIPSMENHTGGTVSVVGNLVSGSGTTWSTDSVCSGNRIGFGSTDPNQITQWYTIISVVDNTNIIISREYSTDGIVENLNLSGGTPYVIEDLRLIYVNRGSASSTPTLSRGIGLVKGLRYDNFTPTPLTIPAATTVDNLRACYRILDSSTTSATFIPTGIILEDKVSFTEQYLFVQSNPATTSIDIQRFNIRTALTVTDGRSDSAFNFTTGTVNHLGTNINLVNSFIKGSNGDYYVNLFTRISRIIPANITNGSTNFIGDTMIETPPGTSTTFPLSSQLSGFHYLPNADRFYISHNQGTTRNYVTPYSTTGEFERVTNLNDTIESNTYVVSELDTLTSNFISAPLRTFYHDGISYIARDINSNRNVLYTLPIEADKEYHTTTKACIITPEFTTPDVVNYDKVYLNTKSNFNKGRFISPSENVDVYFRTTGTTDDSGSWTLVDTTGDISYSSGSNSSGSTIQFKIVFSTIGLTCIPDKVYGIRMSYFSDGIPLSTPFYEPSLKHSDVSSQIFAWRQIYEFVDNIPNLNIDIYNVSGNTLLLTDNTDTPVNGVWEYSSDNGNNWSGFTSSANTIDNYIRYTPNSSLGTGINVKPILYEFVWDLDAIAFLTAAEITDPTIASAINTLVIDMKGYGVWSKMLAVYPFVGGTATSHKWNLVNPVDSNAAFRLMFFGGVTHNSDGIQGNTTNAYADTFVMHNSTRLTGGVSSYILNNIAEDSATIRVDLGSNRITQILPRFSDNNAYLRAYTQSSITISNTDSRGFYAVSRINDTQVIVNFKGINTTYANNVATVGTDRSYYVMAGQSSTGTAERFGSHKIAFTTVHNNMTDADLLNLYSAVQTFQTTLGRNV
jgi:hypothetical protein